MDTKVIAVLIIGILFGASVGYVGSNQILKPQIEELEGDYEELARVRTSLEENYSELRTELEDLQQEHDSLLEQHFNEISDLNDEILELNEVLSDIPELYSSLIDALILEQEELMEEIAELRIKLAGTVKINEILYNPLGADGGNEWVELYNSGGSTVDLSGWTISGSDGSVRATLPAIDFPKGCFLIVHFGPEEPGMYELTVPYSEDPSAFPDDAYYFVGTLDEVFNNDGDSVAIYMGEPGEETIVDYVAWSSNGEHYSTVAEGYASATGIWTEGAFLDTSYDTGNFVIRGETIGRNSASVDTNKPEDWDDGGGSDAWGPTEGWSNSGPPYKYDTGLFISQFDVNTVLWEYGLNVDAVTVQDIQVTESEESLLVIIDYEFVIDIYGTIVPFRGICTHNWLAVNETSYVITNDIHLTSVRGESFTLKSQRHDRGIGTQSFKSQRTLSATYIGQDGLASPYSYTGTRIITHIASDKFRIDDIRFVLGLDGINRVANSTVVEVVTSDTTSRFTLDAEITSGVEEPESVHMEMFIEMDGDRQFNITMPVYTINSSGYEFNLLEPAEIEFKRVAGQPRDSFGRYEYTSKITLGNPELGYATVTVNIYEEYTKVDGKPIIRGEASASLDGYPVITMKFYIYDWWRRWLRTGLKIVSATAWGVACFAGTVVGAPTCVMKGVAVGACIAGGAATDILISEMSTEKK